MKTGAFKRVFALALCVLMAASMLPASALGAELGDLMATGVPVGVVTQDEELSTDSEVPEATEPPVSTETPPPVDTEEVIVVEIEPAVEEVTETPAFDSATSGTCGDDLTWTLASGVLTISGTGAMTVFSGAGAAPWYSERSSITSVVIKNGVTSISKYAFYGCSAMTSITIPPSVTSSGVQAFTNCTKLEAVYIEDMAAWCGIAFSDKGSSPVGYAEKLYLNGKHVTNLQIPSGVTSIGDYAFTDCRSITNVTIPVGVTSIGKYAFYSCISLTNITIPGSVVSVGHRAFNSCSKLESVILSEGVTKIGTWAFVACSSLKEITIPASVTEIGASAFSQCPSLSAVNYGGSEADWENVNVGDGNDYLTGAEFVFSVPSTSGTCGDNLTWTLSDDGVLTISGVGAISNYSKSSPAPWYEYREDITSIVIESSCAIGYYAFYGCESLTEVTIPDTVTSIEEGAFSGCGSLASVIIPDSVRSFGSYVFEDCGSLTSVEIGDGVTGIGQYAFSNCSNLTSVTLGDSVATIGNCAFENCSSLTSIAIPDGVTSIGCNAFYGTGLTEIVIPASAREVGSYAFCNCSDLEHALYLGTKETWNPMGKVFNDITICIGVTSDISIGEDCVSTWKYCSICENKFAVESKEGGEHNWGEWIEIKAPTIAEEGEEQRTCAVCETTETKVTGRLGRPCGVGVYWYYKDGVLTISGNGNMSNYTTSSPAPWANLESSITSVIIEDGVTSIGACAFSSCTKLTSVTISNSVNSIGAWSFMHCGSLTSITIPDSVTSIEQYAFQNCSKLTNVALGKGVTYIGNHAFWGCMKLSNINIPNGVTNIGSHAFEYCSSLSNIIIPNSVTNIGERAFANAHILYIGTAEDWDAICIAGGAISPCLGNEGDAFSKDEDCVSTYTKCPVCEGRFAIEAKEGGTHSWSDWTETKAPTITEEGEEQRACSACEATESRAIDKLTYIKGDVNGDEEITIADAVRIARYDAGYIELTETQLAAADVNGDGDVTIADAVRIARYDAGYIDEL